jgi:hypothetical protein
VVLVGQEEYPHLQAEARDKITHTAAVVVVAVGLTTDPVLSALREALAASLVAVLVHLVGPAAGL